MSFNLLIVLYWTLLSNWTYSYSRDSCGSGIVFSWSLLHFEECAVGDATRFVSLFSRTGDLVTPPRFVFFLFWSEDFVLSLCSVSFFLWSADSLLSGRFMCFFSRTGDFVLSAWFLSFFTRTGDISPSFRFLSFFFWSADFLLSGRFVSFFSSRTAFNFVGCGDVTEDLDLSTCFVSALAAEISIIRGLKEYQFH